jgi:hypothetical protein
MQAARSRTPRSRANPLREEHQQYRGLHASHVGP